MLNLNKILKLDNLVGNANQAKSTSHHHSEAFTVLNKLKQSHALIYLSLGNNTQNSYQSIILDVDSDAGTISIDELFPNKLILNVGDQVLVTTRETKQKSMTFHTRVQNILNNGTQTSYVLSLPDYVDSHQRREAFRLPIKGQANWEEEDLHSRQAKVMDISLSGVKLSVAKAPLEIGSEIENCELLFSTLRLTCDLKVTRIDKNEEQTDITTIGARMTTLSMAERRKLEQFLMQQQRQSRLQSAY